MLFGSNILMLQTTWLCIRVLTWTDWCLVCPLTYPRKAHNLGHEPIRLEVGTAQSVHLQSFCEVWVIGKNDAKVKKKKNCIFLSWCMVYMNQEGNENPMQSIKFPYITFNCNGFMQNHRTHFWGWGGGKPSLWYIWPLFRELNLWHLMTPTGVVPHR